LTIVAPLTMPVAFIVGLCWFAVGGRARWLLAAGLMCISTLAVGQYHDPGHLVANVHRWEMLSGSRHVPGDLIPFVLGFGPVGPAVAVLLASCWAGLLSSRARRDPQHPLSARLRAQEDASTPP
jgi:hypothetical protein